MRRFLGQQLGAFVYKDPQLQIANHDLSQTAGIFWTHTAGGSYGTAATISGMDIAHGTFYAGAETLFWGDSTNTFLQWPTLGVGDSNNDTFGQFGTFTYPSVITNVGTDNTYYDYTAISNTGFRVNSDLRNDGINSFREVEIVDTNTVRTGKHLVKFDLTLNSGSLLKANGEAAFRLMTRDGAGNETANVYSASVGSNSIEVEVFDDTEDSDAGGFNPRIFFSFTPDSLFDVTISNLEITTVGSGSVSKTHTYQANGPKELFVTLPLNAAGSFFEGVITETSNHYMDKTFIRGSSKVLKKLI